MKRIRSSISVLLRGEGGRYLDTWDRRLACRTVKVSADALELDRRAACPTRALESYIFMSFMSFISFSSVFWLCSSAPRPRKFLFRLYLHNGYQRRRKAG